MKNRLLAFANNIYIDDDNYVKLGVGRSYNSDTGEYCAAGLLFNKIPYKINGALRNKYIISDWFDEISNFMNINDTAFGYLIRAKNVQKQLYRMAEMLEDERIK